MAKVIVVSRGRTFTGTAADGSKRTLTLKSGLPLRGPAGSKDIQASAAKGILASADKKGCVNVKEAGGVARDEYKAMTGEEVTDTLAVNAKSLADAVLSLKGKGVAITSLLDGADYDAHEAEDSATVATTA